MFRSYPRIIGKSFSLHAKFFSSGQPKSKIINLWSTPRSSSTSLLYSFAQRSDTKVIDEPFYAYYLKENPHLERPYRERVLKSQSTDAFQVIEELQNENEKEITFCKNISKISPPLNDKRSIEFLKSTTNVLLVRDPKRVLLSWKNTLGQKPTAHDVGFEDLTKLLPYCSAVIMNEDLLKRPEGTLRALCNRIGIKFDKKMLKWALGGRSEEGLWGEVWYHRSRGQSSFAPPPPPLLDFPAELRDTLAECQPFYEQLRAQAVRPEPVLPDERNRDIKIWVNGLKPRHEAKVSVFDSSVQGGDAVWEGLRVYNGAIVALHEHLDRLIASAKVLRFEEIPSKESIIDAIRETLKANNMTDGCHIRLTLTRGEKVSSGMSPTMNQSGPTLIVLAEFKSSVDSAGRPQSPTKGTRLITSSQRRNNPMFLDSKIHHNNLLNNILAKIEANIAGVDDALMLDIDGFIAETNATNVFLVKNGRVLTPYADACLPGITRGLVLSDIAPSCGVEAVESRVTLADLYAADECFTTGTMGELVAVIEVDGRIIGNGELGPITAKLQAKYSKFARETATSLNL